MKTARAAVDILMERAGLRTPSSANEEGMSTEMRTQHEALKTERAALDREKAARDTEVATAYHTTVNTRIDAMMDAGIGAVLSRATGLTDFARKTVEGNIRTALAKEISKNPQFQTEMDRLERVPYGTERQKAHMALATRYFQTGLAKIAAAKLAEAGAAVTLKQQAQAQKSSRSYRGCEKRSPWSDADGKDGIRADGERAVRECRSRPQEISWTFPHQSRTDVRAGEAEHAERSVVR